MYHQDRLDQKLEDPEFRKEYEHELKIIKEAERRQRILDSVEEGCGCEECRCE